MQASTNSLHIKNLGLGERWMSIIGGAALVGYSVQKRPTGRSLLAILGGNLIYRGIDGYSPLYKALGLRNGRNLNGRRPSIPYQQGIRVDKAITVNRPRGEVYGFWRNLENLPDFTRHLRSVTQIEGERSHWIADGLSGKSFEWDAEIINDQPNELIAWRSLPGSEVDTAGSVHFKAAPDGRGTEVLVELQYLPPGGALGTAFAKLFGADPADAIGDDLRRFKQVMEAGEVATTAGQPSGKDAANGKGRPRAKRAKGRSGDMVQTASEESFPASDAPSWTP